MAYEDYETSQAEGQPVELYLLVLGTDIWRMHNSIDETITAGGEDYFPTRISRGSLKTGEEAMDIMLPSSHGFPANFTTVAPGQLATLTIFRYHRADPSDVQVRYKGVVRTVSFTKQGYGATIHVIPLTATFDKMIPDMTYQAGCNHVLFDPKCQVVRASFDYLGTPSAAVSNTLTVPGLTASKGDGWATSGYVAYGSFDFRLVLNQSMDVLTLVLPFYDNVVGESVHVYAGCAHDIGICASKFSNEINYGGCPYVPTKDIFRTGI